MSRILVAGGAGFIGSHLVDALVAAGHDVTVVDSLITGRRAYVNRKAHFVHCELRSRKAIDVILRARPEVVHHLAAQLDVRTSVRDPMFDAEMNILTLITVLEGALRSGTRTFVFASSGGVVYGDTKKRPTSEDHPLHPISPYGIAKLACEHYLRYYSETYGLRTVTFRYGNVYGPRQNPFGEAGVIGIFTHKLLRGELPTIFGDGKNARDQVYVADVVRAHLLAQKKRASGVFNIASGKETSINDTARMLQKIIGVATPIPHGPGKVGEQRHSELDIRRAKKLLGWTPKVSLERGLRETVEWFKKYA